MHLPNPISIGAIILEYPPVPIEGAMEAVRAAAERGPVGLISDTGISPGASLERILDREGFLTYFQTCTFSDVVGMAKPMAPMFEITAEALGVAPEELLHIGDLEPTDILGVQRVGGRAALFAGVNPRYLNDTRAEDAFTAWSQFVELLPHLP